MRMGFCERVLLLILMLPLPTFAIQMPVSNLRNEVSGVIFNKMNRSFSSNDPIWKFTGEGLSNAAAGAISGASFRSFGAASPLLGIAFITGWEIGEVIADYFLEKNGYKAKYQAAAMKPNQGYYGCSHKEGDGNIFVEGASVRPVIAECAVKELAYRQSKFPSDNWVMTTCDFLRTSGIAAICFFKGVNTSGDELAHNVQASYYDSRQKPTKYCDVNEIFISGSDCVNVSKLDQPDFKYDDLAEQLKNDGIYDKPSNPGLDADFINGLWQAASNSEGYEGIPYSDENKIIESDINRWRQEHPDFVPTAGEYADNIPDASGAAFPTPSATPSHSGDLPVPVPTPVPDPDPKPTPDPDPTPTPDIHVDVHVDFGLDPHIPSPDLPEIPTGKQIVEPLWNMFPAFQNFKLTTRNAPCPAPEFHLFDRDLKMDAQCIIAENNREAFSRISMFFWVIIAAIIILTA